MPSKSSFKYVNQKSEMVKNLESLKEGMIIIPKWVMVVGVFLFIFSTIFFVTSMT